MRAIAGQKKVSLTNERTTRRSCFCEAVSQFEALISWAETSEGTFSEIEHDIEHRGRRVLRAIFQGHLDLRKAQEPRLAKVEGSDGKFRTQYRGDATRTIETLFGEVKVARARYESREKAPSLCPLDGVLNVPARKYSHRITKQLVYGTSVTAFENAIEQLEQTTGTTVPKRQAEELVRGAAVDFGAFYRQRPISQIRESLTDSMITVATTDGKGILVYPDDLRRDTRKKLSKELGEGLYFRKRMAQVASVYHVARYERSAESIVATLMGYRQTGPKPIRPKPQDKRVWASIVDDSATVIDEMVREGLRRDPRQRTTWVALVDGAEHQLNVLKDAARTQGVKLTIICDLIHVLGYIWEAAKALIVDSARQRAWVAARLRRLLRGEVSQVAAGIRRAKTMRRRKLKRAQRDVLDTCADYLLNHKRHLRYDQYLQAGFPIASGVIEGAVRHLVNDRMAITGAHWRLESAEAILQLRALRSSADFEAYWDFHERCELQRNHLAKYPRGQLPQIRKQPRTPNLRLVN